MKTLPAGIGRSLLGAALLFLALVGLLNPSARSWGAQSGVPTQVGSPADLRFLHLQGTAYERGVIQGQALRGEIRRRVRERLHQLAHSKQAVDLRSLVPGAKKALPPEVWDEIQGIADGSGVALENALLLNLWTPEEAAAPGDSPAEDRGERFLLAFPESPSDTMTLALRNESLGTEGLILKISETPSGAVYALLGAPGEAGGWVGINQAGLAVAGSAAPTLDRRTWGTPASALVGMALSRATTADQAASELAQARRGGGGGIILVEGRSGRTLLMEFTAHRHVLEAPPDHTILWAGQFQDPWLGELALPSPGTEEQRRWLEANRGWLSREKALDWLAEQTHRRGGLSVLLDTTTSELWVATSTEGGTTGFRQLSLEPYLTGELSGR